MIPDQVEESSWYDLPDSKVVLGCLGLCMQELLVVSVTIYSPVVGTSTHELPLLNIYYVPSRPINYVDKCRQTSQSKPQANISGQKRN